MLSGELDGSDRHHFFQRLRRHLSFVVSDCQDELANAAIGSTYTVAAFCCLRSQPERGRSRRAGSGQQATFADASRVFVMNVRNQEANPAARGRGRVKTANPAGFRQPDVEIRAEGWPKREFRALSGCARSSVVSQVLGGAERTDSRAKKGLAPSAGL